MERISGKFDLVGRAIEPIHHGSGSVGNTQMLRTQRIYSQTVGKIVKLPFISGNTIKHMIRVGAVKFAVNAMELQDGTLSKPIVHLLFSGGALGKKGSTVRIDKARELESLFPVLSLCGYSAANVMPPSKIRTGHVHLVCLENNFRMPSDLLERPESKMRANEFRGEEFGTRHEATRIDHEAKRLLPSAQVKKDTKLLTEAAKNMDDSKPREKQNGTGQMIYDFEVVIAGSLWWSTLKFDDLTPLESIALQSAFIQSAQDVSNDGNPIYSVGGKSSVGFGKMSFQFCQPSGPKYEPTSDLTNFKGENSALALSKYGNHLRSNKEQILDILDKIV